MGWGPGTQQPQGLTAGWSDCWTLSTQPRAGGQGACCRGSRGVLLPPRAPLLLVRRLGLGAGNALGGWGALGCRLAAGSQTGLLPPGLPPCRPPPFRPSFLLPLPPFPGGEQQTNKQPAARGAPAPAAVSLGGSRGPSQWLWLRLHPAPGGEQPQRNPAGPALVRAQGPPGVPGRGGWSLGVASLARPWNHGLLPTCGKEGGRLPQGCRPEAGSPRRPWLCCLSLCAALGGVRQAHFAGSILLPFSFHPEVGQVLLQTAWRGQPWSRPWPPPVEQACGGGSRASGRGEADCRPERRA